MLWRRCHQLVVISQRVRHLTSLPVIYRRPNVCQRVTRVRDLDDTSLQRSFSSTVESFVIPQVTCNMVEKYLKQPNVVILDVRTPREVDEEGMIPGANNLPVEEVDAALMMSESDFSSKYGFAKPSLSNKKIFLYCRSGKRASNACRSFVQHDYNNVFTYIGSWNEWSEKHPEDKKKKSA